MKIKCSVNTGIRLDPVTFETLRQLAGPRGGSKLVRALIRSEAARRQIMGQRSEAGPRVSAN